MSFEFTCPFCLSRVRVGEEYLGQSGPCASCGKPVTMPTRDPHGGLVHSVQTGKIISPQGESKTRKSDPRDDRRLLRAIVGVAAAVLGLLVIAAMIVALPAARRQMSIAACNSDLTRMKTLAKALNAYCDRYGSYPPPYSVDATGKPLLSWRVAILPFMGYDDLYQEFALNQPWDSPLNLSLIKKMPQVFCSSNSPDAYGNKQPNFVLITGNRTMFPPGKPMSYKQVADTPTLLIVETLNGVTAWSEPGDIDLPLTGPSLGNIAMTSIGGLHTKVALGIDTQGNAVIIPRSTTTAELDALITPNSGDPNASKDWTIHP